MLRLFMHSYESYNFTFTSFFGKMKYPNMNWKIRKEYIEKLIYRSKGNQRARPWV
jgi:hypothetical protein